MVTIAEQQSAFLDLYAQAIGAGDVRTAALAIIHRRLEVLGTDEDLIALAYMLGLSEFRRRQRGQPVVEMPQHIM